MRMAQREMKGWEQENLLGDAKDDGSSCDRKTSCTVVCMTFLGLGLGCLFVAVRVAFGVNNI